MVVYCVFLSLFFSFSAYGNTGKSVPSEYFDRVAEQLGNDNIPAALELINQIILLHPESIDALKLRTQLFLSLGNAADALTDIESVLHREQGYAPFLLLRCVLREGMHPDQEKALSCYSQAVQTLRSLSSTEELARNDDYVLMVLLAELPEAESIRQRFLDGLNESAPLDAVRAKTIRSFDRSKLGMFFDMLDRK